MRGEYVLSPQKQHHYQELPPRARRILRNLNLLQCVTGTTSACAENTRILVRFVAGMWNYLRVRGEYQTPPADDDSIMELPPHARRIRQGLFLCVFGKGTTSACAENTCHYA